MVRKPEVFVRALEPEEAQRRSAWLLICRSGANGAVGVSMALRWSLGGSCVAGAVYSRTNLTLRQVEPLFADHLAPLLVRAGCSTGGPPSAHDRGDDAWIGLALGGMTATPSTASQTRNSPRRCCTKPPGAPDYPTRSTSNRHANRDRRPECSPWHLPARCGEPTRCPPTPTAPRGGEPIPQLADPGTSTGPTRQRRPPGPL
jgi:hypothetical protein